MCRNLQNVFGNENRNGNENSAEHLEQLDGCDDFRNRAIHSEAGRNEEVIGVH